MTLPRYGVYIPSKGRYQANRALTVKALLADGVPFHVVVEPQEAERYTALVGERRVLVLPFSNLGQGSIPARNWIRQHAIDVGYERHWQLDDNIIEFRRLWRGKRIPCHAGAALRVCEDLTDRYDNVGVSGLAYQMFVPSDRPVPFYRNCHVYSASLINHEMPYEWRGRLNEDTDLCLQALANGWTTLLVNAFMANKLRTMVLGGGNTDDLYGAAEDGEGATDTIGRYDMARSLEVAWPGLVRVVRRFGRYQHSVNWGAFDTPLRVRGGVDLDALPEVDEYGLTLRAIRDPDDPGIRRLPADYPDDVARAEAPDRDWRGLPAFLPVAEPPKLTVVLDSEAARDELVTRLGVTIAKKTGPAWSAWWPGRGRQDLASLRFDVTARSDNNTEARKAALHPGATYGKLPLTVNRAGTASTAPPPAQEVSAP